MDPLAELRAYARGKIAGATAETLAESRAHRLEAVVIVALRALGATDAGAREVLDQARHDARLTVPDASEYTVRAVAAEMVAVSLRHRLAALRSEAAA